MMPQKCESKEISASGLVTTSGSKGLLFGFIIRHGTAAQSSVTFRDGAVSGTIKCAMSHEAVTVAGDLSEAVMFPVPVHFNSGIYAVLTGTNTKVEVLYVDS